MAKQKRIRPANTNRSGRGRSLLLVDDHGSDFQPIPAARAAKEPLEPMNKAQARYLDMIEQCTLIFGAGPAGVGKSYLSVASAADALRDRLTERIIVTRPAVEAGEELGFLPGELDEKFDPYFAPVRQILNKRLGASYTDYLIKNERIQALPLAYMRGHTFENAWVILDEAQNTTPVQMKMFLTRIGENAKVIVEGDMSQKDIKGDSGFQDAIRRLNGLGDVGVFHFTENDIVRSGLCQEIVQRYAKAV